MHRHVELSGNTFRVFFDKDPALIAAVREIPGRRFDPAAVCWTIPAVQHAVPALPQFIAANDFAVEPEAAGRLTALAQESTAAVQAMSAFTNIKAARKDGAITGFIVDTNGYRPEMLETIKSGGEARFSGKDKTWTLPFSMRAVETVQALHTGFGLNIEPGLVDDSNACLKEMEQAIKDSAKADEDIDIPCPPGLAYLPYQRAGIAYAMRKRNVLFADEPGLGKTIQAIGLSNADQSIHSVMVICPASLKINWSREWAKWCVKGLSIGIVSGRSTDNWSQSDVVIINYDIVPAHLEAIHARNWDLLVCDEAHGMKNPKAKRTAAILGCRADKSKDIEAMDPIAAGRKAFLTGTPIVNYPVELWAIIHALCPERFATKGTFTRRYCDLHYNGFGWSSRGASNLDELHSELRANCMVRRLKKDVLKELPPKIRQIIPIVDNKISAAERKELAETRARLDELNAQKVLAYLRDDMDSYRDALNQLRAGGQADFAEIGKLRHKTALAKVPHVVELVTEALENGKVILFAHHLDVIDAYKKAFGKRAVVVDGRTSIEDRQKAVDSFQTDPAIDLFIGGIIPAGVGLTLTASSHVIFAELTYVPGQISQAEDRSNRIGQKNTVLVWHCIVDGSIDHDIATTIIEKQKVIDQALDNKDALETSELVEGEQPEAESYELPTMTLISPAEISAWKANRKQASSRGGDRIESKARARGFALKAESMTAEQIAAVMRGLELLSGVCDGAMKRDGMGFNAADSYIGKALARQGEITALQAAYAREVVRKYVGQVGRELIEAMG